MTPQQKLGNIIREARKNKKMTQAEFAQHLNVNQAAIHKYEKGLIKLIPAEKLKSICEILEMPAELIICCNILFMNCLMDTAVVVDDDDTRDIIALSKELKQHYSIPSFQLLHEYGITETDRFLCLDKDCYPNTIAELKSYLELLAIKETKIIHDTYQNLMQPTENQSAPTSSTQKEDNHYGILYKTKPKSDTPPPKNEKSDN